MKPARRRFLRQFGLAAAGASLASSAAMRTVAVQAAGSSQLPRSAPASKSVSSAGILEFLNAAQENDYELHSFMMARNGHVVAEGWWAPYRPQAVHMLYSLSKSFTSTAVGMAVAEGRLKTQDPVIKFFPDQLPAKVSDHLSALQVEHLLSMSVGHAIDSTGIITKEQDWAKAFLAMPIEHAPGTEFLYDTGATYMLSAIVQAVTGEKLIDYLKPRLFNPLNIRHVTWDSCPRGINTGGFGMSTTTEALAKFGQLYLQNGSWRGEQILPRAWVEQATSAKIQQPATFLSSPGATLESLKQTSDWHQGYGYQFWRCRHGAYRGDGAFGQFCVVMPQRNTVVAITSRTFELQGLLDLVWKHLLPAVGHEGMRADKASQEQLRSTLASLTLPLPAGEWASPVTRTIAGRRFQFEPNSMGAETVTFDFSAGSCRFRLRQNGKDYDVRCGIGRWTDGETGMPGTPPGLRMLGSTAPASRVTKVAAAGAWKEPSTFEMHWRYFETPHQDTVTCRFDGDQVTIELLNSIAQQALAANPSLPRADVESRPILRGRLTA